MRELTRQLTVLTLVFHSFVTAQAQSKPEVVANLERAMKEMEPEWHCARVSTPQGVPGPESPRGTKYHFRCQRKSVDLTVFVLYGETTRDAEKALALSQRLQINESKPVEGIGEQAYELAKERFGWVTFRKAKVYAQVNVDIRNPPETDGPSESELVTTNALIEAAKAFARLVVDHIPA